MVEPTRIDIHLHIYETNEQGQEAKQDYDIWEYGSKPNVQFSRSYGTESDAIQSLSDGGFGRAIVVNLFCVNRLRDRLASELPTSISRLERERKLQEIEERVAHELQSYNLNACRLAERHSQLVPFVSVDPMAPSESTRALLIEMSDKHGARGVKLHPNEQEVHINDERMWSVYETCSVLGLAIIAHSGPARGSQQYAQPRAFADVLHAFPNLVLVLAHIGGGAWGQIEDLALQCPHALFDCSEIIHWLGAPNAPTARQLATLIRNVGPERVMFGSDFPWYDQAHSASLVLDLPLLSVDEKEAILGGNASRIFGI